MGTCWVLRGIRRGINLDLKIKVVKEGVPMHKKEIGFGEKGG